VFGWVGVGVSVSSVTSLMRGRGCLDGLRCESVCVCLTKEYSFGCVGV